METCLEQPTIKKISLPNKNLGSKDYQKKINLEKLYYKLKKESTLKSEYDKDSNPYQNWVTIQIQGTAKIFSNGTTTTNLALPNESLVTFFDKFYKAYVRDCLEV